MIRVLFIPDVEHVSTSERTPALYRLLRSSYDVVGLETPWDHLVYDTERAKWPRYLMYVVDKILLALQGLRLAKRHELELIFCETAHHALVGLAVARILGIRCVWDSHGNVKLFAESVGKGWFFSRLAAALEGFLGKRVDALITVADQDVDAYAEMGVDRTKITVIPTCVNLAEIDGGKGPIPTPELAQPAERPAILFFGNFKYPPNHEALVFINSVLAPYLEGKGLACEIRIAGKDIPKMRFHPFIKVLGFVPDLYVSIRSADLCVVPHWSGQGVESAVLTKVLDIMAAGTPLVMSDYGARGTPGIEDGVHALVASSEEEFLERTSEALENPTMTKALAERARGLIEQRYDWELHRSRLDGILRGRPLET